MSLGSSDDNKGSPRAADLISLREAASLCGLSQSHLGLLIRRGELWGVKIGRNWVTTEKAVKDYLALGLHPGPRSKEKSS
jgi:excisionase family DNA binding protein